MQKRIIDKSLLVSFTYTNYKGNTKTRTVYPQGIFFDSNDYHKEPQWLLKAFCVERQDIRFFAFNDLKNWHTKRVRTGETDGQ